ncbi:MAG: hypothetical protein IJ014_02730 [Rikenellaceae bacterium]|nr:hypothetical protein [Rikenellaceae bacterium]
MRKVFWILITLYLAACNSRPTEPFDTVRPNITIAELTRLVEHSAGTIDRELIICGRVVSSDSAGNFYRRVVISDPTRSAELLTGLYDSYLTLPIGTPLAVRLRGLAADISDGVLRIGVPSESSTPAMWPNFALWSRYVSITGLPVKPQPLTADSVTHFADLVGCFVRAESMIPCDSMTIWGGERLFYNPSGDTLRVYTSWSATFAHDTIPNTPQTLQGIIYSHNHLPQMIINTPL